MTCRGAFALALLIAGCTEKPQPPAASATPAVPRPEGHRPETPEPPAPTAPSAPQVVAAVDVAPVKEDPTAPPGFKVDRLYTAPKEEGSWVCMTIDPKGRLIVSPEQGKLLRLTLGAEIKTEPLDAGVADAQGLLAAHKSLYVSGKGADGAGLYRLPEDGDRYGAAVCMRSWGGTMSEHGPHGLALAPDGRICVMLGNGVKVPDGLGDHSSPYREYREDALLERLGDTSLQAPGGFVVRTDAEGKT